MAPISKAEVHLVCASDDIKDEGLLAYYASLLTTKEQQHHDALRFDHGRRQYLITRALVRWVLSINSGAPPQDFVFATNRWGKPTISKPDGIALAFNVSHTRGLVTCAVALADALGVDVELPSDRGRTFEIAQRFFSAAEIEALRSLPPEVRDDRFFDYWTLKEAYVKARGMGLSLPFDQCTIDLSDPSNPAVAVAPEFDDGYGWQFQLATLSTGHRLAAAVRLPAYGRTYKFRSHTVVPFASPQMGPTGPIDRRSAAPPTRTFLSTANADDVE